MRPQRLPESRATPLAPAYAGAGVPGAEEREAGGGALALIGTLWRGKWIILLVVACAVAVAAVYAFRVAEPEYRATASVALEIRDGQIVDFESVVAAPGTDQASVNTELEVLRSRGLMAKVIDRLGLAADPEFNAALREPDPWSPGALLGRARALAGLAEPAPAAVPSARRVRDKTIDRLLAAVEVGNVPQSYVFEIAVTTGSPAKSALIADTLAEVYALDQIEAKFEATEKATEWLSERVGQLQGELEAAENAVRAFDAGTELVSPERLELLNRQIKDFRERAAATRADAGALAARVAALEAAAASGDPAAMAEAAGTPALRQLATRAAGGGEPARAALGEQFDRALARARLELERAREQSAALDRQIAELEREVAGQSADLLKLQQLRREAEASRLIYEYFLGRLKETSVQQGIQQADSRTLSRAVLPRQPSAPREGLLLLLGAALGLLVGAALVLLREVGSDTFRTPEELEAGTGVPVMGQIPRAPQSRRRRVLEYLASRPASAMAEAVRGLRTSVLLATVDHAPQVVMVTSSVPGEGKTTLSVALAQNLVGLGRRVLVIEGDMRRRTFRDILGDAERRGLFAAVAEGAALADIVVRDERIGVDLLVGERASVNAADFFSSERFGAFLARARDEYDHIVIDTPPVLLVPDARVIGQLADVVLYVVRWDSTPRTQVRQGLHAFATVNVPVTGMVLSQIDPRGMRRYGYTGAYGQGYGTKGYYDR